MSISVLLPAYNCATYISQAIKSILNQTFKDFEFLIIDDGSTDNTEELISRYKDSRIRCIKKSNTGLADTLNYGLAQASNDIILRMDADDIAHPDLIQSQYSLISKRDKSYWIGCNYAVFNDRNNKIKFIIRNPKNHEQIKKGLSLHGYLIHAGSIYYKNTILDLGGYKKLNAFEDYELWLRGINNFTFENNQEVLLYVRYRKDSLSRKNIVEKYKIQYQLQQPYYNNFEKYFGVSNKLEEFQIKGWREYFYGDKKKAREYWLSNKKSFFSDYRIPIALIVSYLPQNLFIKIKELRLRYRLDFIISNLIIKNFVAFRELNNILKRNMI